MRRSGRQTSYQVPSRSATSAVPDSPVTATTTIYVNIWLREEESRAVIYKNGAGCQRHLVAREEK